MTTIAGKDLSGIVPAYGGAGSVSVAVTGSDIIKSTPAPHRHARWARPQQRCDRSDEEDRALDGTPASEGKNNNVSWPYHSDDGLQTVFEAVQPTRSASSLVGTLSYPCPRVVS